MKFLYLRIKNMQGKTNRYCPPEAIFECVCEEFETVYSCNDYFSNGVRRRIVVMDSNPGKK